MTEPADDTRIPADLLPSTGGYSVECDRHRHTIGFLGTARDGRRTWTSFNPCGECPCPAGGAHEWGVLEQEGTGHTWAGCENCGAARPPEEE